MNDQAFSTNTECQQFRLLAWLLTGPLTTQQARVDLDIMNPSQRIRELKDKGHNIVMHRTMIDSGKAKHRRVAQYVLLNGDSA